MRRPSPSTDQRYRSLLQKAVRRGCVDLVITISAILKERGTQERSWFRLRTAVITFEECWPLGTDLPFDKAFSSKVEALIRVTQSIKVKDSAGLGTLAYALSEGDSSVLSGSPDDQAIKAVAHAIQRPDDFWKWVISAPTSDRQNALVEKAERSKNVGWPWDKAFVQAAAYLAVSDEIPDVNVIPSCEQDLPYWVALDRHTPQGKNAFRNVAKSLGIPLKQLEWSSFYFESALTNQTRPSQWWEREQKWRFRKVGLEVEAARSLWEKAKPQVIEELERESEQLAQDVASWKESHSDPIDSLRSELPATSLDNGKKKQLELF